MKIRIRDNSIRLRLTRGEVDSLHRLRTLSSQTGFPGAQYFVYTVESSPACIAPGATFASNVMIVQLPQSLVQDWATTDKIGISGAQQLDDGEQLTILVEKDFACLTAREGEDESDMFAHPDNNGEAS